MLQLDLVYHSQGKWTEVPCIQAAMALGGDPKLCAVCKLEKLTQMGRNGPKMGAWTFSPLSTFGWQLNC